jgi:hypothetical protein
LYKNKGIFPDTILQITKTYKLLKDSTFCIRNQTCKVANFHTSYLEGRDRRIAVYGQLRQKLKQDPISKNKPVWWCMLVILAMQDM